MVERARDDLNKKSHQSSSDTAGSGKGALREKALDLPVYNDLSNVGEVRESILQASSNVDRLIIDGEKVERMDTPTVQMLVAARSSFAMENIEVVFRLPSETMIRSFSDLGLKTEIEAWSI
jgi:anti-anti-sigma regulatory factor